MRSAVYSRDAKRTQSDLARHHRLRPMTRRLPVYDLRMAISEYVANLRTHVGTDLLMLPSACAVVVDDG